MKSALPIVLLTLLATGCGSSSMSSSTAPGVTVHLAQVPMPQDIFYFSGPVNIQYQLAVTNPTSDPVTLSRLDLQTVGPGAYSLRTAATPMNLKVPPNTTAKFLISVWGRARGGYLSASEPVTIRGTAYFQDEATRKSFIRLFNENILPG